MTPHFHNPQVVCKPGEVTPGFVEIKETATDKDIRKGIETVLTSIVSRFDQEIIALTEEELRARWYFTYDPSSSKEWNAYQFFQMLEMYRKTCRQWEDHHHGYMCIVERVRDKYLMPKIREFLANQEKHHE
jgi:hypothetical protein